MQDGSRAAKWLLRIGNRRALDLALVVTIGLVWLALPLPAMARQRATRALRSVEVDSAGTGWTLDLEFEFPIRYLRHTPLTPGRTLRIQVDPLDLGDDEMPRGPIRENLPVPRGEPIPVIEIVYDVSIPGEPFVEIQFERAFAFDVDQGKDFRHLVIRAASPDRVTDGKGSDPDASPGARLLRRARHSIRDGELDLAIALLTRVLESTANDPSNRNRMDARELLGLTHERKGQLAHAQAEYEAYLADHPTGPASTRVRQRLDALLTASVAPRKTLRAPTRAPLAGGRNSIDRELFGTVAVRYFRSESLDDDSGGQFLATNVLTDVDVAGRLESEAWMVRGDLTGTFDVDVAGQGRSDDARISRLSIHAEDRLHGLEATLGRQRRSDSGVLGRFDGLRVAGDLGSHFTLSALVGMPVESTADTGPNTNTLVAGGACNFEDFWIEGLQGQIFVVGRETASMTDRAAVGSEIRYSTEKTYSFVYFDYDMAFDSLNTFLFSTTLRLSPDTDYRFLLERRNSPILTLGTALQGQTARDLHELKKLFSEHEIRDLALDRTAVSWSGTLGATHRWTDRLQISGDLNISHVSGTKTSGGVQGSDAFGPDVAGTIQFLVSDWLIDGGVGSVSFRYFEGDTSRAFTATAYSRFSVLEGVRILPRLRWAFTDSRTQGTRFNLRPSLETYWRYESWLLNVEGGVDLREPISGRGAVRETSYFIEVGIQWQF